MSKHQHDPNANELWLYFRNAIEWVKLTFPVYRKQMNGVKWGILYNKYKGKIYDTAKLEEEIKNLMMDDDVTKLSGIYPHVLTRDERHLSIRDFTDNQKTAAYERQNGICPKCNNKFSYDQMHGDHITPWSKGGKTIAENCQMLCADCNRKKSDI